MKAKRKKNNPLVAVAIVAVVLLLGFIAWGVTQTQLGDGVSGGTCDIEPYITTTTVSALDKGTTVSATYSYIIGDGIAKTLTSGSDGTKFNKGDVLTILVSADNYIDDTFEVEITNCGSNVADFELYATDAMTLEIKDGSTLLTDSASGGAVNVSALASGAQDTLNVYITGKEDMATGELVYLVELDNGLANISSVTLDGVAGSTTVPAEIQTSGLTDAYRAIFTISNVDSNIEKEYKLNIQAGSGKTYAGAVYTTAMSKQDFLDDNGKFNFGIVDESGDLKNEDSYDFDFLFA